MTKAAPEWYPRGFLPPVRVQDFEGPLDVLLRLVEEGEVDVFSVPLASLARQILAWVQSHRQAMDFHAAGQSVLAAANLVRRKVKALLPADEEDEEEGDEEEEDGLDPHEELQRRLQEYAVFRQAAEELDVLRDVRSRSFPRRAPLPIVAGAAAPGEQEEAAAAEGAARGGRGAVDGPALARAFRELLARRRPEASIVGLPSSPSLSVTDGIRLILTRVQQAGGRTSFTSLFDPGSGRTVWIVVFLSLLELVRRGAVTVYQDGPFSPIWVEGTNRGGA